MTVEIDPTDGLGQTELLRRLQRVAEKAALEALGEGCQLQHINQSENTTYKVTCADGTPPNSSHPPHRVSLPGSD